MKRGEVGFGGKITEFDVQRPHSSPESTTSYLPWMWFVCFFFSLIKVIGITIASTFFSGLLWNSICESVLETAKYHPNIISILINHEGIRPNVNYSSYFS